MWNQKTDYTGCALTPVYLRRYNYYVTALFVCIVCCIPAIIIFLAIPVFRDTLRVILHRNLLIAIVVRDILIIMAKKIVMIDALLPPLISHHVIEKNSISCRVLAFFVSAATNSTYACMLMDGLYLHRVIVRTFSKSPRLITIYTVVAGRCYVNYNLKILMNFGFVVSFNVPSLNYSCYCSRFKSTRGLLDGGYQWRTVGGGQFQGSNFNYQHFTASGHYQSDVVQNETKRPHQTNNVSLSHIFLAFSLHTLIKMKFDINQLKSIPGWHFEQHCF